MHLKFALLTPFSKPEYNIYYAYNVLIMLIQKPCRIDEQTLKDP